MITTPKKTVRLTKLKEVENPTHANNIEEGHIEQGYFLAEPKIGERFYAGYGWSTSQVKEILTENTFRTHNSIYKWEIIN